MKITQEYAISFILLQLLFSMFMFMPQLSTCSEDLRGSVSCLDCLSHHDLSGIKVVVKCSGVKELAIATTKEDGSFIITSQLPSSDNCLAKILGGPTTLYVSRKDAFSKTVLRNHPDSKHEHYFTLSAPLKFYISDEFLSSKTYDLPFPPEWGIPPTHFYTTPAPSGSPTVMPIIGIP